VHHGLQQLLRVPLLAVRKHHIGRCMAAEACITAFLVMVGCKLMCTDASGLLPCGELEAGSLASRDIVQNRAH
jgi:hypothetical protein